MEMKATTIVAVKKDGKTVIAGDGQVTAGQSIVMKGNAVKVRRLYDGKVIYGFAGTVADAFTLSEKFAEIQAMRRNPMYMKDYIQQLDTILSSTGEKLLDGPGRVSHAQAMEKAKAEYKKYLQDNLSPVEEAYLQTLKGTQKKITKKTKKEAT